MRATKSLFESEKSKGIFFSPIDSLFPQKKIVKWIVEKLFLEKKYFEINKFAKTALFYCQQKPKTKE